MREALARADHDFVMMAPRRSGKSKSKSAKSSKPGALRSALGHLNARTILGAAAAAVLVGIMLNALLFQTARHPAPLFAAAQPKAVVADKVPAIAPMPAPRPANLDSAPAPVQAAASGNPVPPASIPQSAPQAAPVPTPRVAASDAKPQRDQIAALLGGGPVTQTNNGEARVLAAQKALAKLGFGNKPDGVMGAGTRNNIEKFERDRHMPVTGELGQKTLRALAQQSGIAIP